MISSQPFYNGKCQRHGAPVRPQTAKKKQCTPAPTTGKWQGKWLTTDMIQCLYCAAQSQRACGHFRLGLGQSNYSQVSIGTLPWSQCAVACHCSLFCSAFLWPTGFHSITGAAATNAIASAAGARAGTIAVGIGSCSGAGNRGARAATSSANRIMFGAW
mmetsp:Transcript_13410/g.22308  ORF Transcript_13410/g.22308 Transcript_13410/m.22308 type:complete len:159 (-) Transcript_13410:703-1179(-)